MTIGEIVRNNRAKKGWSMQKLADEINITSGYISDIENNKRKTPPTGDTLLKIAQALNMTTEQTNELLKIAAMERTPDIIMRELNSLKEEIRELKKEKLSNMSSFGNIKAGKTVNINHNINIRNGLAKTYNEEEIIDKINDLPADMQKEVFEFINFKYMMYEKDKNY